MHIRNVIQLFSTVLLLILLLITNIAVYFLFKNLTIDNEMERNSHYTTEIVKNIQMGINESDRTALLRAYLPENGLIRVINAQNEPIVSVVKHTVLSNHEAAFYKSQFTKVLEVNGEPYVASYFPIIWENGEVATLEVMESLAATENNMNVLKIVLIVASLLILIPSYLGGIALSKMILKPINTMIDTMEEIQRKGVFKRIRSKHRPKDELYKMANTFNSMIEILERNFQKQQQFVSDASHELKTPLTIIESYANMLKRWGMKRPDLVEESIDAIYSEAGRMREMTEQMLLLAKNEEDLNMAFTTFNLIDLCVETGKTFENVYQREVHVHCGERLVYVQADEQKIKQILYILLDNARKYSSEAIDIHVGRTNGNPYFSVEDKGIGIPKENLHTVFDRFFRVDKSRTRTSGGTGLGLAIAKKIIDAHHGNIQIESEEKKGTKVTVILSNRVQNDEVEK